MKDKKLAFFGFLTAIGIFMLFSGTLLSAKESSVESRLDSYKKFTNAIDTIEKYYVDDENISDLIDKSIEGLLSNLDAHSSFLNQKKYKELKVQTDGEFGGLGITVGIRDGALTVISPIEDTPADRAGLKSKDIILRIDEKSTLNMTIDEAVGIMRGKPGTDIVLTIVRKGESKPLDVKITRDIIKVKSVYSKKAEENLYIRVTNFDRKVVDDVKEVIKKEKNIKGIILDLRNNPGGLLGQATGLVDLFIDKGVIVSQKGKAKGENNEYRAKTSTTLTHAPMVVLVNGGSASASEIVSGALQDHKRAVVIGEKTFGKGSVQVIMPIGQEEALRLTIARYYLPSGRTIQAVGVTPDVEVCDCKVPNDDEDKFSIKESELKKHLEGELAKVDPKKSKKKEEDDDTENKDIITKEKIMEDMQLKTAIDTLKVLKIVKK
jgi:carboxyl-terminal processing protease